MSIDSVEIVMERIKSATSLFPIAVFTSNLPNKVESVFASTVVSQRRIKKGRGLIGVFDKSMDKNYVKRKIMSCLPKIH